MALPAVAQSPSPVRKVLHRTLVLGALCHERPVHCGEGGPIVSLALVVSTPQGLGQAQGDYRLPVGTPGVEPGRISPSDFKSLASTNSAMSPGLLSLSETGRRRR